MSRPPDSDHEWFRRHLPDHLLDLLVEGEQKRFDAHARHCAPCAKLLASALGAKADWWDGAGHVPVGVLLEWEPVVRGGTVNEAVRAHLAHCEDCRRDLGDLRGADVASQAPPAPVPLPRPVARDRERRVPSWGALAAASGTAVAVTAAALMWPRPAGHAPAPPVLTSPAPAVRAPAAVPAPAPATPEAARAAKPVTLAAKLRNGPVTLAGGDRNGPAGRTEIRIEPGVTLVPLTLPTIVVADDAMVVVELRDGAGALVRRQVLTGRHATMAGGVVLPAEGLADGPYVLTIRYVDPAEGETSREFALDVRISR